MPSYTVTYGDDRPSRPSSKFANPAHGIMGVLGTSGSDPRERGRKRSRSEIEAASRAEYLAKKEHLAKVKGMRDTEKAAEAEKKTSAARAKVVARPDVQAELDRKEEMRLANEARKNKPLERLTPEQIAAKEKAITDRDRSNATSRIATMDKLMSERMKPEGPSLTDSLNKPVTINDWLGTSGPDLRPEQYPAQYDHSADDAARAAVPAAPAAPAKLMRGMAPQQFTNSGPEFRAALEEQFRNPNGTEQMPTPHQLYTRGNAGQGPTMAGLKKFGSDVGESLRGIKDAVDSGAGSLIEASVPQFNRATQGAVNLGKDVADTYIKLDNQLEQGMQSGVDAAIDLDRRVSPYVDQGADFVASGLSNLFDQSATQFDRANAGAARMGQGVADAGRAVAEFADRPLAEGGLRFDPGVPMPKKGENGGATGGSIGAPVKKQEGLNPTSIYELLDKLLPAAMKDPRSMYYFPGKYY